MVRRDSTAEDCKEKLIKKRRMMSFAIVEGDRELSFSRVRFNGKGRSRRESEDHALLYNPPPITGECKSFGIEVDDPVILSLRVIDPFTVCVS